MPHKLIHHFLALLAALFPYEVAAEIDVSDYGREDGFELVRGAVVGTELENICHIVSEGNGRVATMTGSGFLWREQFVIASAHLFNRGGALATGARVQCGSERVAENAGVFVSAENIRLSQRWRGTRHMLHDFAILRLPAPIEVSVPFRIDTWGHGTDTEISYAGFPVSGFFGQTNRRMFRGRSRFYYNGAPRMRLEHRIRQGASGSPLWREDADGPIVIGMINYEPNIGIRLTKADLIELDTLTAQWRQPHERGAFVDTVRRDPHVNFPRAAGLDREARSRKPFGYDHMDFAYFCPSPRDLCCFSGSRHCARRFRTHGDI